VRVARPYAYRLSDKTRAVTVNLSTIYTAYLKPSLLKVWNSAHSTICAAWKLFFEVFFRFTDGIYLYVKWATRELGTYRRQYVDRHVYRILEQVADPKVNGVKEADNGSSSAIDTRIPSESQELPHTSPPLAVTANTLESGPSSIHAVPISAVPFRQMDSSSTSMPKGEATNNPETGTPIPTPLNAEFGSVSVAEKSGDYASTVKHEFQKEFDTLIVSDITPTPTALNTPSLSAEEVSLAMEPSAAEPAPGPTPDSDQDLDDFLRELGVGQPTNSVISTPDDDNETHDEPVRPKSKEERLAETAAKRADIVGRHEEWFEKLHSGVQETEDSLVRTLQTLRDDSAKDIRRLRTHPSKADPNEESVMDTRSLIWLEQDGERLIKGLEMYLRKAEARCNDWKMELKHEVASKEKEKFSDIVSKVEGKFSIRVDDVRLEVHNWYMAVKEREAEEVIRACNVIKDLASRAQGDLALDYTWLDDVTFLDWQKYHDLMRGKFEYVSLLQILFLICCPVYDTFGVTARQIANGTSTDPHPPSDPVLEALDELDSDLQDIILGFNYALSGMRSHGLKVFNLNGEGNDGFFVVKDNEKRIDDLRGVDLGKVELKKEAVGILPAKQVDHGIKGAEDSVGILPVPDAQLPDSESGFDASKVIIGKDKVQVEEALRDIPLEPPSQRHTEL